MPSALEKQFHDAMLDIYERCVKETSYAPRDFRKMVAGIGGLPTAKKLLDGSEPSDGFTTLLMKGRLDLSVEAVVLDPRWQSLFTQAELEVAARRLDDVGYFQTHPRPQKGAGPQASTSNATTTSVAYTHYWTEKFNQDSVSEPLQHVASNDFRSRGVRPGDFIFCFTQNGDRLLLIARMMVERVADRREAERFIGGQVGFADRDDHCVCSARFGSPIRFDRELPVDLVRQLRFVTHTGEVTDVTLTDGGTGVQQQAMRKLRKLTPESAELLHAVIDSEADPETVDVDEAYEAEEWRSKLVLHLRRERDRRIVELKKAATVQQHGRLTCEVCDFDFTEVYGEWGAGFIECHHTKPLAELQPGERTRLEDLALVCANCHRILHRQQPSCQSRAYGRSCRPRGKSIPAGERARHGKAA